MHPATSRLAPPSGRRVAYLALGIMLGLLSPIYSLALVIGLGVVGSNWWLMFLPWVLIAFGIGWAARSRWWILAAAVTPLLISALLLPMMIGMPDGSLASWLEFGSVLLVYAVIGAVPAAVGTWLGRR